MPVDATSAVVIFDVDGTVADCRHRQHHVECDIPDWESFFAGSDRDAPLADGVALALDHTADGNLMWLTGRPERYRAITAEWLQAQGLPTVSLHMRPNDDMRPAAEFKAERLRQIAADHEIVLIVDDDDLVVATLRAEGWPVQHALWMPR